MCSPRTTPCSAASTSARNGLMLLIMKSFVSAVPCSMVELLDVGLSFSSTRSRRSSCSIFIMILQVCAVRDDHSRVRGTSTALSFVHSHCWRLMMMMMRDFLLLMMMRDFLQLLAEKMTAVRFFSVDVDENEVSASSSFSLQHPARCMNRRLQTRTTSPPRRHFCCSATATRFGMKVPASSCAFLVSDMIGLFMMRSLTPFVTICSIMTLICR